MKHIRIFSKNPSVDFLRENKATLFEGIRRPVVINFGSRTEDCVKAASKPGVVVLNHPAFIQNASNKAVFHKIINQYNERLPINIAENADTGNLEIFTPNTVTFSSVITERNNVRLSWIQDNIALPFIVKPHKGSGGEGIVKFDTFDEFVEWRKTKTISDLHGYIIQEVFQPDLARNYEFRISVSPILSGTQVEYSAENTNNCGVISFRRKILTKEGVEQGKFGRNIEPGLSFFRLVPLAADTNYSQFVINKRVTVDLREAIDMCHQLVSLLQLDFGAVDIMYDSEARKWAILEVNTAPSLSSNDAAVVRSEWATALREMIIAKINRNYV